MTDKPEILHYRNAMGVLQRDEFDVDEELPGVALAVRRVQQDNGRRLLQKFVPRHVGQQNAGYYDVLDREIRALTRLSQMFGQHYPVELPRIVGYNTDVEEPYLLRAHGMEPRYHHKFLGWNARLDAIQAAMLRVKLPHLDRWSEARQAAARRYDVLIEENSLEPYLLRPVVRAQRRHVFNQYVIRVAARDELRTALQTKGVGTEIYYPVPMHMQECFASLGYREGDFKESEGAAAQTLALPIYPELTDEQACYVVDSIRQFYGRPD